MTRDVIAALRLLVLPTVALVVIVVAAPGRLELAARIYALIVGVVALVVAIRALRRIDTPEEPLRRAGKPADRERRPPPSLIRAEQLAALGVASSFDLQYRLVPQLRATAADLLESRRRIVLETDPDAARRVLGDEAWELVRPMRPAPEDRISRGLTSAQLSRVVDALERI
jgi:hypothetical protein